MAEQGVEVGEMEQAVQQAAVPQMPLGMLDEPLRRLLHIGRKPAPEKRAVGDLERVPRGRRRKKRSGSRATRSRSLPLSRSNRRQSAGRNPASVVLPHCRGPMMAMQGNAARYSAKRGSQARFMPCRIKPEVWKCKPVVALLIPARQPPSPFFPNGIGIGVGGRASKPVLRLPLDGLGSARVLLL